MAKNDNDLFERLRQVGIRKQVAKTLSEIGEGAGKKARNAARSAVSELRSVADEIERRMPGSTATANVGRTSARGTKRAGAAGPSARASRRSSATASSGRSTRSAAAKPRASRSRSSAASPASRSRRTAASGTPARATRTKTAARSGAKTTGTSAAKTTARSGAKTTATSRAKTAATPKANGARAPRGQNKAKILTSLKSGPKTASVIAKETGIGTGTVGSTLSKLATSGEVVKASRGYGLPG